MVEAVDTKMIRSADNKDTRIIVELLREFLTETSYSQSHEAVNDLEHLCKITWTVQQHGYIWLAFIDDKPVGLLMALKQPNMWLPRARELRELVWFVKEEHRSSSIGGRLFLEFQRKGDQLLNQGLIDGYFTTRMTTTDTIDFSRRGFRLVEQTYMKER